MSIPFPVAVALACCCAARAFTSKGVAQVDDGPDRNGPQLVQAGDRTELSAELDWCLQQLRDRPRLNRASLLASCQRSLPVDTCQAASAVLRSPPFSTETVVAACRELSRAALGSRARQQLTLLSRGSRGRVARVSSDVELDAALRRKKEKQPYVDGPPYTRLNCTNMTKKTNKVTKVANVSMPNGPLPEGCWIWEDAYTTTTSTSTSTTTVTTRNGTAGDKSKNAKKTKKGSLVQLNSFQGTVATPDESAAAAAVHTVASSDTSNEKSHGGPWMRLTRWPW